jgi:hypothetical protein
VPARGHHRALQKRLSRALDYRSYDDIREAIDTVHRDNSLKKIIRADIGRYISRTRSSAPRSTSCARAARSSSCSPTVGHQRGDVVPARGRGRRVPNYFDFIVTAWSCRAVSATTFAYAASEVFR